MGVVHEAVGGIFGLPVVAALAAVTGALPRASALVAAAGSLLLAMALRFCLTCAAAQSAFWTQRASGAVSLVETLLFLLGGVAAPLTLLPGAAEQAGRLLPFWSALGAPAEIASGEVAAGAVPQVLLVQAGWLLLLAGVLGLVWRRGIRRFTVVGG